jgi:hypothetical protein
MARIKHVPPDDVTAEVFARWRSPARGVANPELMTNPPWAWVASKKLWPYAVNALFQGPDSREAGPCWCFSRFGQSKTVLPDGRVVLIGGEHEDWYDPDF